MQTMYDFFGVDFSCGMANTRRAPQMVSIVGDESALPQEGSAHAGTPAAEAQAAATAAATTSTPPSSAATHEGPIKELLEQLAPLQVPTLHAERFLLTCKGDVGAAAKAYREMLEWRAREGLDRPDDYPASVQAALDAGYSPIVLDGVDVEGRPVMVNTMGSTDLNALAAKGVTLEMLAKQHARAMDALQRRIDAAADPRKGHLLIIDIGDASVLGFTRSLHFCKLVFGIGDKYFPETLGKLCIVRAPTVGGWVFATIRGFLDQDTQDKMEFTSGDPDTVLRKLLAPETTLPAKSTIGPWPAWAACP